MGSEGAGGWGGGGVLDTRRPILRYTYVLTTSPSSRTQAYAESDCSNNCSNIISSERSMDPILQAITTWPTGWNVYGMEFLLRVQDTKYAGQGWRNIQVYIACMPCRIPCMGEPRVLSHTQLFAIDPLPCHPGKNQNIGGHIVLDQNVCVI